MNEKIVQIKQGYDNIRSYLLTQKQVSFLNEIDLYYKKILIFSVASYFENIICSSIYELAKRSSPLPVAEFIRNKAVERQYHTYFNWKEAKSSSINVFLGLWGAEFKDTFLGLIKNDTKLDQGIKDFLIIGNERNLMAHENFMEYDTPKTFDEVFSLYKSATYFVEKLLNQISDIFKENIPNE